MPRAFLVKRFGAGKNEQAETAIDEKIEEENVEKEKFQNAERYRSTNAISEYYASQFKLHNDEVKQLQQARCVGKVITNPYFGEFMVASRGISGHRMVNMESYRLFDLNKELIMAGCSPPGSLIRMTESRCDVNGMADSTDDSMVDGDYDWCDGDYDDNSNSDKDIKLRSGNHDGNNNSLRGLKAYRRSHIDSNNNSSNGNKNNGRRDDHSSIEGEDSDESEYAGSGFLHQHHHEGGHDKMRFGGKPQFQCTQCDKTFKTKYTLNIHRKMPSHTTLKPFVCPTCGKGFRLSSTLCRHKIIHTSQRPHRCHVCQKSFNRSSTLKTHLRTHSNVKEFTCTICGKGFHQKGNLRNHVLIHTGEKPYECSVCKKSFNKLSNLKFHMHSHTDQKPYRCRHCKQSFSKRGELKQHIAHCKRDTAKE